MVCKISQISRLLTDIVKVKSVKICQLHDTCSHMLLVVLFAKMKTFILNSCICGYHIYKDVWTPSVGETVNCEREGRNLEDPYTVALQNNGTITVGHIPRTILCVCTLFLRCGGAI